MACYIALVDYTEQGIREIKDSPRRADEFVEKAGAMGVKVKDLYWTSGGHDGVLILEAADDAAVSALMLQLAQGGNVRTRTLRAYQKAEMSSILDRMD